MTSVLHHLHVPGEATDRRRRDLARLWQGDTDMDQPTAFVQAVVDGAHEFDVLFIRLVHKAVVDDDDVTEWDLVLVAAFARNDFNLVPGQRFSDYFLELRIIVRDRPDAWEQLLDL